MAYFNWRGPARFVGYFDLTATILAVVILIGLLIWGLASSTGQFDPKNDIFLLILLVAIIGLIVGLQTFLSLRLLSATKIDADPQKALKQAKLWFGLNIVLLLLAVIFYVHAGAWKSLVILAFVRGGFIALVWNYLDELIQFCNDNPFLLQPTV